MRIELCVLASGSAGNCSVVRVQKGSGRHCFLIDAGLSPRRTRARLRARGACLDEVEAIVLTHLDTDHASAAWTGRLPEHSRLHVHRAHLGRAGEQMFGHPRTLPFDGEFEVCPGVSMRAIMAAHDEAGVAAFRIDFVDAGASLGFATDVGRMGRRLVEHLRGVDVLAIESNYCPRLQLSSSRPEFLKRRIMGGRGHLSNEECERAVREIEPREHVVLLHLSRECNRPEIAAAHHEGGDYTLTIASQTAPTRWVRVGALARRGAVVRQPSLFEPA